MSKYIIRNATVEDINTCLELATEMHQESRFSKFSLNLNKLSLFMDYLIKDDSGIVLVAIKDDEIVGGFMGLTVEHWFGNSLASYDTALFVKKSERGGSLGYLLIKEYIRIAKEMGVEEICIGNSTGVDFEKVEKLYMTCGFSRVGGTFRMDVKD